MSTGKYIEKIVQKLKKNGFNRKSLLIKLFPPLKIKIDNCYFIVRASDNYTERQMLFNRQFDEPNSIEILRNIMSGTAGTFMDIGVNCGAFLVPITKDLGVGGRTIGFEPNPVMHDRAAVNVRINGLADRVSLRCAAVSNRDGTMTLHLHPTNLGEASLATHLDGASSSVDVEIVDLRRILTEEVHARPLVLKMDIEGHEPEAILPVMQDCPDMALPDAIMIETANRRYWSADIIPALAARGYTVEFEGEGNHLFVRSATTIVG